MRRVIGFLLLAVVAGCQSTSFLEVVGRPEADQARDEGRRPTEVVDFLGVESGDTVLDLAASGGYYSEVFAHKVGASGTVYAHNLPGALQANGGVNEQVMTERISRLSQIQRIDRGITQIDLPSNSVDVMFTALNLHDVYNANGEAAIVQVLAALKPLLKPDGVLGVIDHVGTPGNDNAQLHRIQLEQVRTVIQKAGYTLDAESELLANPDDDHRQVVFAPAVRGKTDRLLVRAKPN